MLLEKEVLDGDEVKRIVGLPVSVPSNNNDHTPPAAA
jgi:hypothetical protein